MTHIADILMIIEVDRQRSVQPLVQYLRDRKKPFTDGMRDWLIRLLEHKTKAAPWLKYVPQPGRRRTDDRIIRAYHRVRDLTNAKVTDRLCRDIAGNLNGRRFWVERPTVKTRYAGRIKPAIYHIGAEFEFVKGKRVSHEAACRIAALQFGLSRSYVKRVFRKAEEAGR
jgi:hypothetical protein